MHNFVYVNLFSNSKFFHYRIQQEIAIKPYHTVPITYCYTTLRNLKYHFCHFPLQLLQKYVKIRYFSFSTMQLSITCYRNILRTQHQLPSARLRVLYLPSRQRVSSLSTHSLCVSVSRFSLLNSCGSGTSSLGGQ